jgi:hypothetical protein
MTEISAHTCAPVLFSLARPVRSVISGIGSDDEDDDELSDDETKSNPVM